tara:strand:+ start:1714 stop:2253 length:540 start_codon:yes stop_codon:yes gene_type:complete
MSFLSTITSRLQSFCPGKSQTYTIIDGPSLSGNGRGARGEQTLKRLADITEREGMKFSVVFSGSPFRDIKNGGKYRGVTVHFSSEQDDFTATVEKILRRSGSTSSAVVVTSDKDLERAVLAAGASVMRASTFRKAFDDSQQGKSRNGSRSRPRRRPARRKNKDDDADGREAIMAEIDLV